MTVPPELFYALNRDAFLALAAEHKDDIFTYERLKAAAERINAAGYCCAAFGGQGDGERWIILDPLPMLHESQVDMWLNASL